MTKPDLSDEERRDRLRLIKTENIGPVTFQALINRYGSAGEALAALPQLSRKGGMGRPLSICSRAAADNDIERASAVGASFVAPGEQGYPPLLSFIDGAPPLLCVMGNRALADREAVAIVGSRNASAAGRKFARQIAAELSAAGFSVASGLARGIDTAAHEAALEHGTVAVLAGGIDIVYPPENQALQEAISAQGLLITEMTPGVTPRAEHFPRRNRIISGISRAVVVIEAAARSGSLITARLAAEQGREVFAVPGSPLDPRCAGTNSLIKNGAALLTDAGDVIGSLRAMSGSPPGAVFLESTLEPVATHPSDDERARIVSLLSHSPVEIDDLIRESGAVAPIVIDVVLELELAGKAVRHGRQLVSLA
jgi:DNA processing protein